MKKILATVGMVIAAVVVLAGAVKLAMWGYRKQGEIVAGHVIEYLETAETE